MVYERMKNKSLSFKSFISISLFWATAVFGQSNNLNSNKDVANNDSYIEENDAQSVINDNTIDGQKKFVNDLMSVAGYKVDEIIVYQNLPNFAKIFRVIFNEETQSGFIFIRWDKKKKENYVANKMIDPQIYYNLKVAKEIMRQQTDKKAFNIDDVALQAPDQETLSAEDLEGLRQEYDLKQEEKKLKELEKARNKKKRKKN